MPALSTCRGCWTPRAAPSTQRRRTAPRRARCLGLSREGTAGGPDQQDGEVCRRLFLLAMPAVTAMPAATRASAAGQEGYDKTARELVKVLVESIELEESGAPESEVRRAADPSKQLVREFLNASLDSEAIGREASYKEISVALKELGQFYLKAGQRSRLPADLAAEIKGHLLAAQNALPTDAKA